MLLPPVFGIGIFTGIGALLSWLFGAVATVAEAIAAALAAVWSVLGPVLLSFWHALDWIWNYAVKPAWDLIKRTAAVLQSWYNKFLAPVVDYIQRITKALRTVYRLFIQPIRDAISILEQFLTLTGLAHTALGTWLDSALHLVDAKINQVWADLTKPINAVLRLINEYILDARGLLQAPLLLESTAAYMGYIAQQFWDASLSVFTQDWHQVIVDLQTPTRVESGIDSGVAWLKGRTGPLVPHVDHAEELFRDLMSSNYDKIADDQRQDAQDLGLLE